MQRPLISSCRKNPRPYRFLLLFNLAIVLSGGLVFGVAAPHPAYATTATLTAACPNASSTKPDSNSLLVVLLDRSGSLGFNNGGTDIYNYSASVTDALSDLWPGPMAVVPFYSNGNQLITTPIGPLPPGQRDTLKSNVDSLPSNGWTPLAEAMQAAQNVLTHDGTAPAGSEIVVITDGQPQTPADQDGSKFEEPQVLNKYAPMFCQENVPVNPIGLTIPEDSNPARFLLQVATESGGSYQRVSNANELAGAVIGLYAAWDGLEFNRIQKDQAHGYYPIVTDSSVQSAYILTFYQSGKNEQLTTTSGITPQYTSTSDGRHYEIDTLLTPGAAATYTVRTADPNAVVYDLVTSTRALQIVSPVPGADAFTGESVPIQAQLFDEGQGPFVPNDNGQPFFQATVIETIRGHALPPVTIDLTRQQAGSSRFVGTFAVPADAKPGKTPVQIGTLRITVMATYQSIEHTTNPLTILVVIPKYIPPPPPPCTGGFLQCQWPHIQALVITSGIVLLFLLLFLFLLWRWLRQPVPFGTLSNVPQESDDEGVLNSIVSDEVIPDRVGLGETVGVFLAGKKGERKKRSLSNRLFHRSVMTSDELRELSKGKLNFSQAKLEFVAREGPAMYIRPAQDNPIKRIRVMEEKQESSVGAESFSKEVAYEEGSPLEEEKPFVEQRLQRNSIILIKGERKVRYS